MVNSRHIVEQDTSHYTPSSLDRGDTITTAKERDSSVVALGFVVSC